MSVYIFRNKLNQEMRTFGSFTNNIVSEAKDTGIDVDVVFSPFKDDYLENFHSGNTYIIISHGSYSGIYHKYDRSYIPQHQVLVDINNLGRLQQTKIIAISCGTAKILGPQSVSQGGCESFLGFVNAIHFDKKDKQCDVCKYYTLYIRELYKRVFSKVLSKAVIEKWTFKKLARVLEWELKQEAVKSAENEKRKGKHAYFGRGIEQSIFAVTSSAASIKIFGNGNATIS